MDPWALAYFAMVLLPGKSADALFQSSSSSAECISRSKAASSPPLFISVHNPLTSPNSVGDACYHIDEAEVDCDKTIHGHPCCVIR